MKNKILILGVLAIVFIFAANAYVVGQSGGTGNGSQAQQQDQTANQGEDIQLQAQTSQQMQSGNATSQVGVGATIQTQQQAQQQSQDGSGAGYQTMNQEQVQEKAQISVQAHAGTVSDFVQSLLQVADKEGGVGEQVRLIAQQQNQSASTTIQAMEKVQTRNKVQTFLFGSDYKNLGALRSETVQTRNRLQQLNNLMVSVQSDTDKVELQAQVQVLEQEQTKIENFIKEQEGKFSLFGWLVRVFSQ